MSTPSESAPYGFVFPGQGSQEIGMGKDLSERFPAARAVFDEADDALGFALSALCFAGDADELALTANTQPAILTCSIAALAAARSELGDAFVDGAALCFGHSLGELSALVAAGALAFADAVRLVRLRGEAMQAAVPAGVGAMAAILRLDPERLEALCAEVSAEIPGEVVSPANENGGGQIVVAGHAGAVERLSERAAAAGGRAIPLKVSAPFHCALMKPAAERLDAALAELTIRPLRIPVITNVDAEPNLDHERVRALLVRQVTERVRWEASVRKAVHMGVQRVYEVGHGRVLAGLNKRIDRNLTTTPLGSPRDIDVLKDGAQ
ncbi:MAG: ACP S-malonyltransferase [Myxococcales bacterium]|nr:ACP S-malonyltransferase [Myxococcales bacterium]MCB9702722.1 ACP S-malonyltransferase [Myxococcales bacterium]